MSLSSIVATLSEKLPSSMYILAAASGRLGDTATTYFGLEQEKFKEIFPGTVYMFDQIGMGPTLAIQEGLYIGLFCAVYYAQKKKFNIASKIGKFELGVIALYSYFAIVNNVSLLAGHPLCPDLEEQYENLDKIIYSLFF